MSKDTKPESVSESPFNQMAWAMGDLHNILPEAQTMVTTGTSEVQFASVSYHGADGNMICTLGINHPTDGNYLAVRVDHPAMRSTKLVYALRHLADHYGLKHHEYQQDDVFDGCFNPCKQ
jgi:hypothetical protein